MTERAGRRDEIVRAAFHQVANVGFEGLRLRQIAEDVGVDHSTLHHHFPGKQDIVAAVAKYAIGRTATAPAEGAGPVELLRNHLTRVRTLLAEEPEIFVVTAELELRARRDPLVRAVMEEHEAHWRHWLRELLTGDDAWSDRVGPEDAVELVIAVVKGVQLAPESAETAFRNLLILLTVIKEKRG